MLRRLIILLFIVGCVYATTINVPADSTTIQAGINGAEEGDTVLVAAGTYYENIFLEGSSGFKLIGSGEDDCIINGSNGGAVFAFIFNASTIQISHFSIEGGIQGITDWGLGSGILLLTDLNINNNQQRGLSLLGGIDVILRNVTIDNNQGGGIWIEGVDAILDEVTVSNNNSGAASGGGMFISGGTTTISNSQIFANQAKSGGGIYISSVILEITNTNFENNTADRSGGAINMVRSTVELNNVIISNNQVEYDTGIGDFHDGRGIGGGVCCIGSHYNNFEGLADLIMTDVIISENMGSLGGGVALTYWQPDEFGYCNADLTNVTITNNTANRGGGIWIDWISEIEFNDVYRSDIYSNNTGENGLGSDLYKYGPTSINVIVDTFTVMLPSEDYAYPLSKFNFDILNAFENVNGCVDTNACNYNQYADTDDGSCTYAEENYDCDGNCIVELDCSGVCGGNGVDADDDGVCDDVYVSCLPLEDKENCDEVHGCYWILHGEGYMCDNMMEYNNSLDDDGDWELWADEFGWRDDKNGDGNPADPGEWGGVIIETNETYEWGGKTYGAGDLLYPHEILTETDGGYLNWNSTFTNTVHGAWMPVGVDEVHDFGPLPFEPITNIDYNIIMIESEPFIDSDGDSIWNNSETFTDMQGNGLCDKGELLFGGLFYDYGLDGIPDTDDFGENDGVWQPGDGWVDANENGVIDQISCQGGFNDNWSCPGGYDTPDSYDYTDCSLGEWNDVWPLLNGLYDYGETYIDANNNGYFDNAEEYVDINNNGIYDYTDGIISHAQWEPINYFPLTYYDEGGSIVEIDPIVQYEGYGWIDGVMNSFSPLSIIGNEAYSGYLEPQETYCFSVAPISTVTAQYLGFDQDVISECLTIENIYGCTDPDACNYDPDATATDSCNDCCEYVSCLAIEELIIPDKYSISSIYPNPFNPTTKISFSIPEFGLTTITAYDITGREIEILTNTNLNPGNYSIDWNASSYPSGVYLIRMDSGDFTQTQKVVLVK